MSATALQLIRVDDDRIVVKRGITEVLVEGPRIESTLEKLLALMDEGQGPEEILAAFPETDRPRVLRVMRMMVERRLVGAGVVPVESNGRRTEASFYACFGLSHDAARERLKAASVVVYGVNLVSRALVSHLVHAGVGRVSVAAHPQLTEETVGDVWLRELEQGAGDGVTVDVVTEADVRTVEGSTVLCATSDLGEAECFEDLNRRALEAGKRFLPAWIKSLVGYVGPLVHPFDTACYRCYRLRADSNDPRYEVARAIRQHETLHPGARGPAGLLPPMAGIVGDIAAMEVLKVVTQIAPSDVAGRLIRINLVSFESVVHRVLKVPRCPDCSDVMKRAAVVTATGPQIPFRA